MTARRRKGTAALEVVTAPPRPAQVTEKVTAGNLEATAPPPPCEICGGGDLWRSIHDRVVCNSCHPPAAEFLVAERIQVAPRPKPVPIVLPPVAMATSFYGRLDADERPRDEAVDDEEGLWKTRMSSD